MLYFAPNPFSPPLPSLSPLGKTTTGSSHISCWEEGGGGGGREGGGEKWWLFFELHLSCRESSSDSFHVAVAVGRIFVFKGEKEKKEEEKGKRFQLFFL